ncbi:MAG: hypothetical protein ACOVLE_07060, partial [Pirellula staleyi]
MTSTLPVFIQRKRSKRNCHNERKRSERNCRNERKRSERSLPQRPQAQRAVPAPTTLCRWSA